MASASRSNGNCCNKSVSSLCCRASSTKSFMAAASFSDSEVLSAVGFSSRCRALAASAAKLSPSGGASSDAFSVLLRSTRGSGSSSSTDSIIACLMGFHSLFPARSQLRNSSQSKFSSPSSSAAFSRIRATPESHLGCNLCSRLASSVLLRRPFLLCFLKSAWSLSCASKETSSLGSSPGTSDSPQSMFRSSWSTVTRSRTWFVSISLSVGRAPGSFTNIAAQIS
mmetsp:Transcript_96966/g.230622  ORF Transcript_96966/g.230622 Transcript_96966/m.230622 type:complete len:225 (-) Transcript_96966:819-1493(-)